MTRLRLLLSFCLWSLALSGVAHAAAPAKAAQAATAKPAKAAKTVKTPKPAKAVKPVKPARTVKTAAGGPAKTAVDRQRGRHDPSRLPVYLAFASAFLSTGAVVAAAKFTNPPAGKASDSADPAPESAHRSRGSSRQEHLDAA